MNSTRPGNKAFLLLLLSSLAACTTAVSQDDGDGGGGAGGGLACVDPGAELIWSLTLPDGTTHTADELPSEMVAIPLSAQGVVTLDGNALVIGEAPNALRLEMRDQDLVDLPSGVTEGAAVVVTGELSSIVYPGSPVRWFLDLRVDNDPTANGIETGERLWLLVSGGNREQTPFTVDRSDSCELPNFNYQSDWVVKADGVDEVIPEGQSRELSLASGADAGNYVFSGFNATAPLEGSFVSAFVLRRSAP